MNFLNRFYQTIEIAGKPLGEGDKAYKMDGGRNKPDMREHAGLGSCKCCDYFLPNGEEVVLIEETQLFKTIMNLKKEYSYLPHKDKGSFVLRCIENKHHLKVYGAMLVLCRLAAKCDEAKELIRGREQHAFWLVVSGIKGNENKKYLDNLQDRLDNLRSLFKRISVKVMTSDEFIEHCQK